MSVSTRGAKHFLYAAFEPFDRGKRGILGIHQHDLKLLHLTKSHFVILPGLFNFDVERIKPTLQPSESVIGSLVHGLSVTDSQS